MGLENQTGRDAGVSLLDYGADGHSHPIICHPDRQENRGSTDPKPPPLSVSVGGGMNCLRKRFFRKIYFSYKNEPASQKNNILSMRNLQERR